jgi:hypothetical protein
MINESWAMQAAGLLALLCTPLGAVAEKPSQVEVVNPVLPVEIRNADPIQVSVVSPQPDVRCGDAFVASATGPASGGISVGGSGNSPFDNCPEMYIDYVMIDPSTTLGVAGYRFRLGLQPQGGGNDMMLALLTFDTATQKLPVPVHFVPGMRLSWSGECVPIEIGTYQMTCAFGVAFIGRSISTQ